MDIVLVGLGQSLRSDDAFGLIAVQLWQEKFPLSAKHPSIRVEISQLPGLALIDLISGADAAIIVDAVNSGSPPGTIHIATLNELSAFAEGSSTAHGWGVAETLALGLKLSPESLPAEIFLIGVEGESFDPGEGLSTIVAGKLPTIADLIEAKIQDFIKS